MPTTLHLFLSLFQLPFCSRYPVFPSPHVPRLDPAFSFPDHVLPTIKMPIFLKEVSFFRQTSFPLNWTTSSSDIFINQYLLSLRLLCLNHFMGLYIYIHTKNVLFLSVRFDEFRQTYITPHKTFALPKKHYSLPFLEFYINGIRQYVLFSKTVLFSYLNISKIGCILQWTSNIVVLFLFPLGL